MAMTYLSPGVFVEEPSLLPPSVAEVSTAVPAFIGYTKQAKKPNGDSLLLKPTKIFSLTDFEQYFGGPFAEELKIEIEDVDGAFRVKSFTHPTTKLILYWAVRM